MWIRIVPATDYVYPASVFADPAGPDRTAASRMLRLPANRTARSMAPIMLKRRAVFVSEVGQGRCAGCGSVLLIVVPMVLVRIWRAHVSKDGREIFVNTR